MQTQQFGKVRAIQATNRPSPWDDQGQARPEETEVRQGARAQKQQFGSVPGAKTAARQRAHGAKTRLSPRDDLGAKTAVRAGAGARKQQFGLARRLKNRGFARAPGHGQVPGKAGCFPRARGKNTC